MSAAVDLETWTAFTDTLADASGRVILPSFRRPLAVDSKAGGRSFDPVTEADRAAERCLRALIAEHFPDHGIVGEEYGEGGGGARLRWILDPIDGTRAFISGMPLWGTLIGLCEGDEPVLGCVDQPYLGERYTGSAAGAWLRGRDGTRSRLATRACPSLAEATLYSTDPAMFRTPAERDAQARVAARARLARWGGDCYAYCMLAAGHIDLVVEADLRIYDVAALVPIIESAGGVITAWDGRRDFRTGRIVAAGDRRVHAEAVAILGGTG